MADPGNQRRQLTYSGHVQGVGFRYTARAIAQGYDVVGYVRNLPDGRVELLVEGVKSELDQFLNKLSEQMAGRIRSVDIDRRSADQSGDQFADFEIRY